MNFIFWCHRNIQFSNYAKYDPILQFIYFITKLQPYLGECNIIRDNRNSRFRASHGIREIPSHSSHLFFLSENHSLFDYENVRFYVGVPPTLFYHLVFTWIFSDSDQMIFQRLSASRHYRASFIYCSYTNFKITIFYITRII